jgi:hypothetical protein
MSWDNQARLRLAKLPKLEQYGKAAVAPYNGQYRVVLRDHCLDVYDYRRNAVRLRNAVNLILKEYE